MSPRKEVMDNYTLVPRTQETKCSYGRMGHLGTGPVGQMDNQTPSILTDSVLYTGRVGNGEPLGVEMQRKIIFVRSELE